VPGGVQSIARLVSQQALNAMTINEALHAPDTFTPLSISCKSYKNMVPNYAHFALPMVHPTIGETITSYKRLMHNPETAEVWQTVISKDFGGMAQGDDKMGQKGKNSVFLMTRKEMQMQQDQNGLLRVSWSTFNHKKMISIKSALRLVATFKYKGNTSTRTADLTMSKLLWNSILSFDGAKYMCLDINIFYLTAASVYFEYMKIPLALFPEWVKKQYNLDVHARDGFVFLEIRQAMWDSLKPGFWPTNSCRKDLPPMGITNVSTPPGYGNITHTLIPSPSWWMILV
jgi:hypothetical protein